MKGLKVFGAVVLVLAVVVTAFPLTSETSEAATSEYGDYYDQLTDNQRQIYQKLLMIGPKDISVTGGSGSRSYIAYISVTPAVSYAASDGTLESRHNDIKTHVIDDLRAAYYALTLEQPLAICTWGNSYVGYNVESYINDTIYPNVSILRSYYLRVTIDPVYGVDIGNKVDRVNDAISSFNLTNDRAVTTKAAKIRAVQEINDYLTERLTYDRYVGTSRETAYCHDVYGALVDPGKTVVCEGFSKAMQALCQKYGLECYTIYGYSSEIYYSTGNYNSAVHAWNIVKIDNGYYGIDVTWNQTTNNKFLLTQSEVFNPERIVGYTKDNGGYLFEFSTAEVEGLIHYKGANTQKSASQGTDMTMVIMGVLVGIIIGLVVTMVIKRKPSGGKE